MTDRNRTYQNGRVSTHSDVQCGSANRQTSFSGRGNARKKLPFSGHIANKFRRPTITSTEHRRPHWKQDERSADITSLCSLRHSSSYCRRPTALMQRSWYFQNTTLAWSSLSRKHGLATFVHERLRYTLSSCLRRLKISKIWIRALVVAIPKPGKPVGDPNSYRPISLLCVPYKILERLIYARVEPLIDPLLPKEQAGFRRGKSNVDQVVLLTQNIKDSFETKKKAGAVFIDLTAAYDIVWHRGLGLQAAETTSG